MIDLYLAVGDIKDCGLAHFYNPMLKDISHLIKDKSIHVDEFGKVDRKHYLFRLFAFGAMNVTWHGSIIWEFNRDDFGRLMQEWSCPTHKEIYTVNN